MESSETLPQPVHDDSKPVAAVPFEVVRRAEFVFEPFMGSLIQLPEVRMQRPRSSEFFLPQSTTQQEAASAKAEEVLVWERPIPVAKASAPSIPIPKEPPSAIPEKRKGNNRNTAKEPEGPRFYQPPTVRFFDPVAAAGEDSDGTELQEQPGPRQSTQLSPELKAAILRIDEQRRQSQQEAKPEKPSREKKRGLPKAKPVARPDARDLPIEIVMPRDVALTERAARWEEISAPPPRPAEQEVRSPAAELQSPAIAAAAAVDAEQTGAFSSATDAPPEMSPVPAIVPALVVASAHEVVSAREETSLHSAAPPPEAQQPEIAQMQEAASLPGAILTDTIESLPPAVHAQPTVSSLPQRVAAPAEIIPDDQPSPNQETLLEPEIVVVQELASMQVAIPIDTPVASPPESRPISLVPVIESATLSLERDLPTNVDRLLPLTFAAEASSVYPVESEHVEPPSPKRTRNIVAAFARAKRAEPVMEPVEIPLPVEEPTEEEEGRPRKKKEKLSLAMRLQRWFGGEATNLNGDRRRADRTAMPGLVAFYWSGGSPRPHEILNISKTGFYLKTSEFWSIETLVRMTLQRPPSETTRKAESISVLARVVRIDEDGVGHEFVTTQALTHARSMDVMPSQGTDIRELDKFLQIQ